MVVACRAALMSPIRYKSDEDIGRIGESAQLVSKTLVELKKWIKPGRTPLQLDKIAETFIRDHQAEPAFLGLYDFPNTLCVSINEVVVHGVPNHTPLQPGDIVSVDCGVLKNGFYGDQAFTFAVEHVAPEVQYLLDVTQACLQKGIEACRPGLRIGDIGHAIQTYAEERGFGVVRELVGHGIGKKMHESPEVPNFGKPGQGKKLKPGLVVAIEPMITLGKPDIRQHDDGWTIVTRDGQPAAHYEHTVAILNNGKTEPLSSFEGL